MSKKVEEKKEEVKEVKLNEAQVEFKKLMVQYEKNNPVKFAAKKAELEAKLAKVTTVIREGGTIIIK